MLEDDMTGTETQRKDEEKERKEEEKDDRCSTVLLTTEKTPRDPRSGGHASIP